MNRLVITDDGKLSINDYRSLPRAILFVLSNEPLRTIDLVKTVRRTHHEFKFTNEKVFAQYIGDLMHAGLIESKYEHDFVTLVRDDG